MFALDSLTRTGLLLAGIAGAYALGANNIANVVGIFVPISPFSDVSFLGIFKLNGAQQLFFIGAAAIAVGTFTYGKRVMLTVGAGITEMSPVAALVAVLSNALVLFLFASEALEQYLLSHGLPAFPLVPVSSSQAIVGSVIGIGLVKGGRGIRWRMLGEITGAWMVTPLVAIVLSFISLFFLQNVFLQKTYIPVRYQLTTEAEQRILEAGISTKPLADIRMSNFSSASQFQQALSQRVHLTVKELSLVMAAAEVDELLVSPQVLARISDPRITDPQRRALQKLWGKHFTHRWQFEEMLADLSPEWRLKPGNRKHNEELRDKLDYIHRLVRAHMQ
jgi:PiT family inorganic phosphate transporter